MRPRPLFSAGPSVVLASSQLSLIRGSELVLVEVSEAPMAQNLRRRLLLEPTLYLQDSPTAVSHSGSCLPSWVGIGIWAHCNWFPSTQRRTLSLPRPENLLPAHGSPISHSSWDLTPFSYSAIKSFFKLSPPFCTFLFLLPLQTVVWKASALRFCSLADTGWLLPVGGEPGTGKGPGGFAAEGSCLP